MVRTEKDEQIGARRVAKRPGAMPWLALLALIPLVLAAVAAWFLFVDDDGDVEAVDQTTATTAESGPPTSEATTGDNPAPAAGEVFAGGQRVLPGDERQLTQFVGQPAQGRTVRVTSVPSDESFWVDTSNANRVFVHLALSPGESPFDVQAGETVTFSGTMKAVPSDAGSRFGLTAAEGLNDLRAQGAYIEATKVTKG